MGNHKGYHLTYEKAKLFVAKAGYRDPDRFLMGVPLKMVHGKQVGMLLFRLLDLQDRLQRLGYKIPDETPFLTKQQIFNRKAR